MKQGGIEVKADRILIFEPKAIGLYGVDLMVDGLKLTMGSLLKHCDCTQWMSIEPLFGSLMGMPGLRETFLCQPPPGAAISAGYLKFSIQLPKTEGLIEAWPVPHLIWIPNEFRRDPFGRIPVIELKHFTTRPPRD